MTANGAKLAEGRLQRAVPNMVSIGEGLDIGCDTGSPIDFPCQLPFAFTGKIAKVTVERRAK